MTSFFFLLSTFTCDEILLSYAVRYNEVEVYPSYVKILGSFTWFN